MGVLFSTANYFLNSRNHRNFWSRKNKFMFCKYELEIICSPCFLHRTFVLDWIVPDKCAELLFPKYWFFECHGQDVWAFVPDQLLGVLVPCQYFGTFVPDKKWGHSFLSDFLEHFFLIKCWRHSIPTNFTWRLFMVNFLIWRALIPSKLFGVIVPGMIDDKMKQN